VTFTVLGVPQTKGSTRLLFTKKGKAVVTSDNRNLRPWEHTVALCAVAGGVTVVETGPMRMDVEFVLPRPRSAKRSQSFQAKRPDLDKLVRAVLDALTGVAWTDDGQVSVIQATKRYALTGEPAGASVTISAL
jgi:crossover junction endodeoxyribonuclease RusA